MSKPAALRTSAASQAALKRDVTALTMVIVAAAVAAMWPALLNGSGYFYNDTPSYYRGGETAVLFILDLLRLEPAGAGAAAEIGADRLADRLNVHAVRSAAYSLFMYLTAAPFGLMGVVFAQAAIAVTSVALLLRHGDPTGAERIPGVPALALALAAMVALTSLPWYAAFLIPDMFSGVLMLCALIAVDAVDRMGVGQRLALIAIAAMAAASHYSNLPLALALGLTVLTLRLALRRWRWGAALMVTAPIVLAAAFNAATSYAAFGEPSVTPKRLPTSLARSMMDGPARWHLEEACPERGYTVCAYLDRLPADGRHVLWGENGLLMIATPDDMEKIRREEFEIVSRAVMQYPLTQALSLAANAGRQFILIGNSEFFWAPVMRDPQTGVVRSPAFYDKNRVGMAWFMLPQHLALFAAAAVALWRVRAAGVTSVEAQLIAVLLVGLAANAAITGGLSEPIDRYQTRVIWALPALALLFLLHPRVAAGSRGDD